MQTTNFCTEKKVSGLTISPHSYQMCLNIRQLNSLYIKKKRGLAKSVVVREFWICTVQTHSKPGPHNESYSLNRKKKPKSFIFKLLISCTILNKRGELSTSMTNSGDSGISSTCKRCWLCCVTVCSWAAIFLLFGL